MKLEIIKKNITNNLFKGSLIILPFIVSFYFLAWVAQLFDKSFSQSFKLFGVDKDYPFGIGVMVGLVFLYFLGKVSDAFIAKSLEKGLEKFIKSIPVLGTVFSSVHDVTNFFKKTDTSPRGKAVIVTFENPGFKIAGFLTKTDLQNIPTNDSLDELVAVYIPLAYMVGGGFTVFVHNKNVKDLEMPFDKAMQASLSAWMVDMPGR